MDEMRYHQQEICSWTQLLEAFDRHSRVGEQWVFRGHSQSAWGLETTLERALKKVGQPRLPAFASPDSPTVDLEMGLLRKFQRECHRFDMSSTPADDDYAEWFAWMRHFGAPSRLLDCSYSFFIAAFMALSGAEDESAIWAFNTTEMRTGLERTLDASEASSASWHYRRDPSITKKSTFSSLVMARPPLRLVASVNPLKLNERLVVQQGVFLCPGDVSVSFEANLQAVLDGCGVEPERVCIKYWIPGAAATRREILRNLLRMNISQASLFPGLEGFAKSLWQWLVFPEIIAHKSHS